MRAVAQVVKKLIPIKESAFLILDKIYLKSDKVCLLRSIICYVRIKKRTKLKRE